MRYARALSPRDDTDVAVLGVLNLVRTAVHGIYRTYVLRATRCARARARRTPLSLLEYLGTALWIASAAGRAPRGRVGNRSPRRVGTVSAGHAINRGRGSDALRHAHARRCVGAFAGSAARLQPQSCSAATVLKSSRSPTAAQHLYAHDSHAGWKRPIGAKHEHLVRRQALLGDWLRPRAWQADRAASQRAGVRVVTFSFLCPLLEKYGTFIA
eukprot:SAG31_NODE_13948_length_835_cov_2.500000_1_plen_212_part_10